MVMAPTTLLVVEQCLQLIVVPKDPLAAIIVVDAGQKHSPIILFGSCNVGSSRPKT
jgi:hypothetical protein